MTEGKRKFKKTTPVAHGTIPPQAFEQEGVDLNHSRNRRFGIASTSVILITLFIDLTGFGMIIPLLPFYAQTFHAGPTALGILVTSFSVMQFLFSPLLGKLSDRVGRRPVLLLSILTSLLSFLLFATATSYLVLLLSRIVAGLATESAVAQAYIADVTSEADRATGMGKVGAAVGAGFIVGPAMGGLLSGYGFSAPGFAAAALAAVNFVFVVLFLPESMRKRNRQNKAGRPSRGRLLRRVFTTPLINSVLIILFFLTLAFATIPVIVPLLSLSFFGFGSVETSYLFIYVGVIQIVLQGFLIRRLVQKSGEERLIVVGPLFMMVGMLLMPLSPNLLLFGVALALIAFANGLIQTAVPSFISKRTPADEQGGFLGAAQSIMSIARIPGPLVAGFLFEVLGLSAPFYLSAGLLALAFVFGCRVFQACALRN